MACAFTPQAPIFGQDETPIFGADETVTFGALPPCSLTLRDQFAMSALIALGADQTYNIQPEYLFQSPGPVRLQIFPSLWLFSGSVPQYFYSGVFRYRPNF